MKKWLTSGAPDDPGVWRDVLNFWPTRRGTYAVSDGWDGGTNLTATGETTSTAVVHGFVGATLSGQRTYLFTDAKNWEYSGGSLTDRTNSKGGVQQAVQHGDSTIAVRGTGATVVVSTGGNFSDLGGSPPNSKIICAAGNAVGLFNTASASDAWAICSLNNTALWTPATSNTAATGFLRGRAQGPITAATTMGKSFIVFKRNGIYRGDYVGGTQRWLFDLITAQYGCLSRYAAADCGGRVVFVSGESGDSGGNFVPKFYIYDGQRVERMNPFTEWTDGDNGGASAVYCLQYDPLNDRLYATATGKSPAGSTDFGTKVGVYSFATDQWGLIEKPQGSPILGDYAVANAAFGYSSPLPPLANVTAANQITLYAPEPVDSGTHTNSPLLTSNYYGSNGRKTRFSRCTPRLFARTDLGSGSLALSVRAYRDLHDTSAESTDSVTESTQRNRFDFMRTDNFAAFTLTANDTYIEVDGLDVEARDAGAN